jgi:purine-binding chemotaxis protein CheW
MAEVNQGPPRRVLMLGLGDEIFALDASMVREILDPVPVTRVPGAPDFAPGVINVRGAILPLADLRVRFGMEASAPTQDTRFLVLEIGEAGEEGPLVAGIVADRVYEVTDIEEPPPSTIPKLGMNWSPDLVRGVALWKGEFVIVPDLAAILH